MIITVTSTIFLGFFITFILASILATIALVLNYRIQKVEKVTPYECGFDPFFDTRIKFDVRFYVISILFIIFDIEIILCIPWAMNLFTLNIYAFYVMMCFLIILLVGFIYEWVKGVLDW